MELEPGGFHQYSGLLGRLGSPAQGYVQVEKVSGDAPFYAYGVINDNFNSDGSFVFPLTASSLVGSQRTDPAGHHRNRGLPKRADPDQLLPGGQDGEFPLRGRCHRHRQ